MPGLLEELSGYDSYGERFLVQIVGGLASEVAMAQLGLLSTRLPNVEVQYRQGRVGRMAEVQELEPDVFDSVILLGSELHDDPKVADAETVMTYVLVARYLRETEAEDVHVVAEVHDEDNRRLFGLEREVDILMTQEISSHILSQVAVRRALAWIYEELFSRGGPEIRMAPLEEMVRAQEARLLTFADIQRMCLEHGQIALGYWLSSDRGTTTGRGIHLNPPRQQSFAPQAGDRIVLLGR